VAWTVEALIDVLAGAVDVLVALVAGADSQVVLYYTTASSTIHQVTRICTSVVRIAVFLQRTLPVFDTLHPEAADLGVGRIPDVAGRTGADSLVVLHCAHGSLRTLRHCARVCTVGLHAGQSGRTVRVRGTLVRADASRGKVGISDRSRFAGAPE